MDYTLSIAGLFFTICGDLKDAEYFASHAGMRGSPNLQRPDPSMMFGVALAKLEIFPADFSIGCAFAPEPGSCGTFLGLSR